MHVSYMTCVWHDMQIMHVTLGYICGLSEYMHAIYPNHNKNAREHVSGYMHTLSVSYLLFGWSV